MATPDLTLVSEATLVPHLDANLTSAKGYADTKKNEAISAAATDATTKANAAKAEAIEDATTKYGGLGGKISDIVARELPDRGRLLPADYPGGIGTVTLKGRYAVWTSDDATALGLPFPAAGSVNVFKFGNVTMYQQKATTSEGTLTFENWKTDTGALGEWSEPRNTGYESRLTALEASTTRVAAVALSTGDSGGLDTATSRNFRYPIELAATVRRFRVHVMNANPRYGNRYSGALTFTGLGIAKHAGATDPALEGQFDGAVTSIDQGFTTNSLGYEYVSPWVENDPIKGYTEYLLTGGYTCAAQDNFAGVGGGWMTANANDWNVAAPTGMAVSQKLPLYVWLEVEVDANVSVGAWLGDSLASGVSARLGVFDSAPNRHALANGYIPTLYTNSGTKMADHTDPAHFKWTRYDTANGLTKPDFLVWELFSNDVFEAGVTAATLRSRFDACWAIAAEKLSPNIALMTVLPRHDAASPQEPVRKEWNEILLTELPGKAIIAVDAAAPLTNADGSTLDQRFSATPSDIHLTGAGYARYMSLVPPMHG